MHISWLQYPGVMGRSIVLRSETKALLGGKPVTEAVSIKNPSDYPTQFFSQNADCFNTWQTNPVQVDPPRFRSFRSEGCYKSVGVASGHIGPCHTAFSFQLPGLSSRPSYPISLVL